MSILTSLAIWIDRESSSQGTLKHLYNRSQNLKETFQILFKNGWESWPSWICWLFLFLLCFVKNKVSYWTREEFNRLSFRSNLSTPRSKISQIFTNSKVIIYHGPSVRLIAIRNIFDYVWITGSPTLSKKYSTKQHLQISNHSDFYYTVIWFTEGKSEARLSDVDMLEIVDVLRWWKYSLMLFPRP